MPPTTVRSTNSEQRVLRHLRTSGVAMTRRAIAHDLDLPVTTVGRIVAKLVLSADLEEVHDDSAPDRSGRPPALVRLAGEIPAIGVLSWGDARITSSLVAFSGRVLAAAEHAVGPSSTALDAFAPAVDFLRTAGTRVPLPAESRGVRLHGVVLSVPGPFLPSRGSPRHPRPGAAVRDPANPTFLTWLDYDPSDEVAAQADVPALAENNANLAALGESRLRPKSSRTLICLRIDHHGIGAGIVVDGRLHRGASGFAGEIGHIQVTEDGPPCECGSRGCLVDALDLPAGLPRSPTRLDFVDTARRARAGQDQARRQLVDIGRLVGRRLADVCMVLDPDAILVGGRLGDAGTFVARGIREQIDQRTSPIVSHTLQVSVSTLGPAAETWGAVELARHQF